MIYDLTQMLRDDLRHTKAIRSVWYQPGDPMYLITLSEYPQTQARAFLVSSSCTRLVNAKMAGHCTDADLEELCNSLNSHFDSVTFTTKDGTGHHNFPYRLEYRGDTILVHSDSIMQTGQFYSGLSSYILAHHVGRVT